MKKIGIFEKQNADGTIEVSSKRIIGTFAAVSAVGIGIAGLINKNDPALVIGVVTALLAFAAGCFGFTLKEQK